MEHQMKYQIKRTIIGLTSLVLAAGNIPSMDMAYAAALPQEQAQEQAATVSEVTIARTGPYFESSGESHFLAPGYAMNLIANVKMSDGTLAAEDMADVEWKIVSKSGKKVRTCCKINKPLTEAEAESELDRRGVTGKGTREGLKEGLIRSTVRLYVPCGYKNVEDLRITATSKTDPTVRSKVYVVHVVKEKGYMSGKKSYFQFSTGKKSGGKVGKAKETWDAEKVSYQVKLPTATTKNKWLKFEGWKKKAFPNSQENAEDENKVYKAGTVIEDKPVLYGGFMELKASWKDLRVKDALDVRYRLDDTKKTVTVQKILSQKQEYVSIPKTVTYKKKKYPVTAIKKDAFAGSSIKGIEIGRNVKTIGSGAFSGCRQMGVIEIQSAKIEKIGKNAFRGLGKDVTVICPKKCVKRYRTMLRKAGLSKSAVVKGL